MNPSILKKSFDKYYNAPLQAWNEFYNRCDTVTFKKDETLKHPDTREKYFYFIIEGSAGIFLQNKNHSVCLDFSFDHEFHGDYLSLLIGEATPLQSMALEKSKMLRISRQRLFELGARPLGNTILRIAAEASFINKQQQQIDLLTKDAQERYRELTDKFPFIMRRIPLKHIASYIGVTPQSLSRLRR